MTHREGVMDFLRRAGQECPPVIQTIEEDPLPFTDLSPNMSEVIRAEVKSHLVLKYHHGYSKGWSYGVELDGETLHGPIFPYTAEFKLMWTDALEMQIRYAIFPFSPREIHFSAWAWAVAAYDKSVEWAVKHIRNGVNSPWHLPSDELGGKEAA